ncbi:hypothetical protein DERF_009842 [Dermatophagoides farinae]|uniref:Uncharacterized protein n=1 Tax=Dermatophagoides farinae TaxID=6954 RepID=A0A922L1B7_DERFA|nr:hypothetical protein DERF_009842 [Dermatophagoides farinae]
MKWTRHPPRQPPVWEEKQLAILTWNHLVGTYRRKMYGQKPVPTRIQPTQSPQSIGRISLQTSSTNEAYTQESTTLNNSNAINQWETTGSVVVARRTESQIAACEV